MAKHKRIKWERLPLLETWQEHADDRVVIDGTVTLLADGDVIINNRWFRGNWLGLFGSDAIDFPIPGGHAYRDKHSNRLARIFHSLIQFPPSARALVPVGIGVMTLHPSRIQGSCYDRV